VAPPIDWAARAVQLAAGIAVEAGGVATGGVAVGVAVAVADVAATGIGEPEPPPQAVTPAAAAVPIHLANGLSFKGVSYVFESLYRQRLDRE
jgi:hypothetical protein